jgi:hypothetical protein
MDETRCVEELLASCPGFRRHWDEHCAWWGGSAGLTLDLAVFGEYAAQAIQRADPAELAAIAASSERLLSSESEAVRDAAVVGFLASLMRRCQADAQNLPFERFARELGPAALAACRGLDEKLGTRSPGLWERP